MPSPYVTPSFAILQAWRRTVSLLFPYGVAFRPGGICLVAATAAAGFRAPLAEPAVGTIMFFVRRFFQAADQSVRGDFEAHTVFIDILFLAIIARSIHVSALLPLRGIVKQPQEKERGLCLQGSHLVDYPSSNQMGAARLLRKSFSRRARDKGQMEAIPGPGRIWGMLKR